MIDKATAADKRGYQAKGNYFLSGILRADVLIEIMQLLNRMACTGDLVLELASGTSHLYFQGGEIISITRHGHALDGIAALNALLRESDGFYYFIEREVRRIERSESMTCPTMIMQVLVRMDEEDGAA